MQVLHDFCLRLNLLRPGKTQNIYVRISDNRVNSRR